ncbi:MAG: zf-HC2 domain-containing protein [bacterium]
MKNFENKIIDFKFFKSVNKTFNKKNINKSQNIMLTDTCEIIEESLSSYFDNEVDTEHFNIIKEHLKICKKCESKYSELKKLSNIINSSYNSLNYVPLKLINAKILNECKKVNNKLSSFIDNEISDEDAVTIKTHINNCKSCQRDYENLKMTSLLLNDYFQRTSIEEYNKYLQNKNNSTFSILKFKITKTIAGLALFIVILTLCFLTIINNYENKIIKSTKLYQTQIIQAYGKIFSVSIRKK